jgi:hypothetical protein
MDEQPNAVRRRYTMRRRLARLEETRERITAAAFALAFALRFFAFFAIFASF